VRANNNNAVIAAGYNNNGDGDVDSSNLSGIHTAQVHWLGLRVGGHLALSLHSTNEPGELSQWLWP